MNPLGSPIMNRSTTLAFSILTFLLLGSCSVEAQETIVEKAEKKPSASSETLIWSQWRGPNRDGMVAKGSADWPQSLDDSNFTQVWRKELAPSYSGPILSKKLVFTTETRDRASEWVTAYDRKTGKMQWETSWNGAMQVPFFAKANGDWIRSTPSYDGKNIYVAGMRDVLVCLNAANGEEQWRVDFVEKFGTKIPDFGFVCSPLTSKEHVYVQAGASFFKLNKSNGEVVWRSLDDGGGMMGSAFSSPVIAELAGKRQLVVQSRSALAGIDDQSGEVLWSKKIKAFRGMNILTPTVVDDTVFTSAYGGSAQLFNINKAGDQFAIEENWNNRVTAYMSSPIVIDGHLYLHMRNQRFTCIDLKTGESKWTTKPFGKYWSMVANGDRILALDERGDLMLIKANTEKFELLATRKISNSPSWAHIAVAGEDIYIRELNSLVAYCWSSEQAK